MTSNTYKIFLITIMIPIKRKCDIEKKNWDDRDNYALMGKWSLCISPNLKS